MFELIRPVAISSTRVLHCSSFSEDHFWGCDLLAVQLYLSLRWLIPFWESYHNTSFVRLFSLDFLICVGGIWRPAFAQSQIYLQSNWSLRFCCHAFHAYIWRLIIKLGHYFFVELFWLWIMFRNWYHFDRKRILMIW